MQGTWSDRLAQLQREGVLTGFALLTSAGACKPATGPFAELQSEGAASAEVRELLIVVQQSAGSFCAVSKRRDLGLAARHLPCGVLLATFAWPVPAQRVWRRAAQTALRVAVTATKAARSRAAEATAAGTRDLTDLTNQILAAAYLPARPLGVLAGEPGLLEAAAEKLARRQGGALARLEGSRRKLEAAAQDMRAAAAAAAAEPAGSRWQARAPVFSAVPLPAAAEMLSEIATMAEREAAAKRDLVAGVAALAAGLRAAAGGGGEGERGGGGGGGGLPPDALRERLTVAIAAWLSRPFSNDERAELLLGVLTEDMAGF
ncbi:MAG: hypothetical protein J3K34DRAFT_518276 [Monoraphidium minutum]|nr:MAG: hypothetical protein J3K34DRAFT_518276 [Monoraphidium minutum]